MIFCFSSLALAIIQSLYPPTIPHAMIMPMVARRLKGVGRLIISMMMRNGVIIIEEAEMTIIQYHLDVRIERSIDRVSRIVPMKEWYLTLCIYCFSLACCLNLFCLCVCALG